MESFARYRNVRSSAQKIRLVANLIRGKKVEEAMRILAFSRKKASYFIRKVLCSAVSNAKHNSSLEPTKLKISKIFVDNGPSMKRTMPRAKGRADRIIKRTSHITIILSDLLHGDH